MRASPTDSADSPDRRIHELVPALADCCICLLHLSLCISFPPWFIEPPLSVDSTRVLRAGRLRACTSCRAAPTATSTSTPRGKARHSGGTHPEEVFPQHLLWTFSTKIFVGVLGLEIFHRENLLLKTSTPTIFTSRFRRGVRPRRRQGNHPHRCAGGPPSHARARSGPHHPG